MRFSIITIHYNQSDTLKKLFNSLLAQKEYVYELVIYDDGSEEKHKKVIQELHGLPMKILFAKHKGKHLSHHFNKALEVVSGDTVIQIFGDSYLREDALKNLSDTYIEGSIGCGYEYLVSETGNILANDYRFEPRDDVLELTGKDRSYYAIVGNSLVAPTKLLRKMGGADERFMGYGKDDTDIALRGFMNGARLVCYNNVKVFHPFEKSEQDNDRNTKLLNDKIGGKGMNSQAKTVIFDTDDFSLENNAIFYLDMIKKMLPNFKISCFTIPWDYQNFMSMQDFQREEVVKMIKERPWIEMIPHGLTHKSREFELLSYGDYDIIFQAIDEAFKKYDLPYVKGFKAPYWLYNKSLVEYLDQKGWWMAVDRNQPSAYRTKRYYEYSHSLDEPFWLSNDDTIRLHSHIGQPSSNNIPDNILKFSKFSPDTQFKFVSELDLLPDKK